MVKAKAKIEEEELSPEAKKVLAKLKEAIKDTELLTRIAKLLAWFEDNYGLGGLMDTDNLERLEGIKMKKTAFAWLSRDITVAMPFDTEVVEEQVAYSIDLSYVKPLHKHLDELTLAVVFPAQKIDEALKKIVKDSGLRSKIIKTVYENINYPVYAVDSSGNIALIIAPRVDR